MAEFPACQIYKTTLRYGRQLRYGGEVDYHDNLASALIHMGVAAMHRSNMVAQLVLAVESLASGANGALAQWCRAPERTLLGRMCAIVMSLQLRLSSKRLIPTLMAGALEPPGVEE